MDFVTESIKVNVPLTFEVVLNHGDFLKKNLLACVGCISIVLSISFGKFFFPDVSFAENLCFPSIVGSIVQSISIGVKGCIGGVAAALVFLIVDDVTCDSLYEILMNIITGIGTDKARFEVGFSSPRACPCAPFVVGYGELLGQS